MDTISLDKGIGMKDIILPVTCGQIWFGLFIVLGATAIPSLIYYIITEDGIFGFYGAIGTVLFGTICGALFLIAWAEGRLPRFPIRCKCE